MPRRGVPPQKKNPKKAVGMDEKKKILGNDVFFFIFE